jgi:hypothetical protein
MTTVSQKLVKLGYVAHTAGKWDVGMSTQAHTPEGRGFNSSMIFFSHAIDGYLQHDVDGLCGQEFVDLWTNGAPARSFNGTGFFDDLALAHLLAVIAAHDFSSAPLFIQYTPHVVHNPLQAPQSYLDALNYTVDDESQCAVSVDASATGAVFPGGPNGTAINCRRTYEAMVAVADHHFGAIQDALRARGVWDETLMLFSSDNGGQNDLDYGGGSNYPLRGFKGSWWEGGCRAAAFASGGYLPPAVRGSRFDGIMHIADWAHTLCIAGGGSEQFCASDPTAAEAGLPPPDSLNLWPALSGANLTSPRTEFAAEASVYFRGNYKLLLGDVHYAAWTGPVFPNASSPMHPPKGAVVNCGSNGCLFDVVNDMTEHVDIAKQHPDIVADMINRLTASKPSFYSNNETGVCEHNSSLPISSVCACDAARVVWGGYMGPYATNANRR